MLIASLITDKQPIIALSLSLSPFCSYRSVRIWRHSLISFFPFSEYNKNKRCLSPGRNSCQCCGCGCSVIVRLLLSARCCCCSEFTCAGTWVVTAVPPTPHPPVRPRLCFSLLEGRLWVPLLLCCEKILKTSAKFMYSASTLAYCVKAQSVLNGLTMLCGAFSILAFNTPLPS